MAEEETESCISGAPYGKKSGEPGAGDEEEAYGKLKGGKKKQGIFRGLGSMFRFGRHRKSAGATSSAAAAAAALARAQQQEEAANRLHEAELAEQQEARNHHHQEQVRKLQHQQHQEYLNSLRNTGNYQTPQGYVSYTQHQHPHHQQQPQGGSLRVSMPQGSSGKSSRKSEATTRADKDINGNTNPNHGRSTSFDVYNEMQRPGSRMGIVDPKKYTHYINYEEIRHHLK